MTVKIDLKNEDGQPHWLKQKPKPLTLEEIRQKNRDKWLAAQKEKREAEPKKYSPGRRRYILARARRHLKEFDESKHPRDEDGKWTDGGGGSDNEDSGVEFSPAVKASGDDSKHAAVKSSWIENSPIKSIDDIVTAAPVAQDLLGEIGRGIASKYGVEFKDPGPKTKSESGVERTKVKIAERGGNAARVTDAVRATFVVDKPGQVDDIVKELGKKFEVTVENWKTTLVNYADRAALVRFPNGLIGEIQFMDQKMSNAKSDKGGNGHGLYVEWRALNPKIPEQKAKADGLIEKMRILYGGILNSYSPDWKAVLGKLFTLPKRVLNSVFSRTVAE